MTGKMLFWLIIAVVVLDGVFLNGIETKDTKETVALFIGVVLINAVLVGGAVTAYVFTLEK